MADPSHSRLEGLLQKALPRPDLIKSGGDSAIVALALHCAHPFPTCMPTSRDCSAVGHAHVSPS